MGSADCRPLINVFTRRPIAGQTKTRLVPALGEQGAALLAAKMLEWTLAALADYWPGDIRVMVAADIDGSFSWPAIEGYVQAIQRGDDLGERMLNAIADDALTASECPRGIIGADVPHVPGATLKEAAYRLTCGENVVGPSVDGGFYFIGMDKAPHSLFEGISWGADDVYRRVMDNADRLGMTFYDLPELRDIDTPADLEQVAGEYPPLADYLLQTGVDTARADDA